MSDGELLRGAGVAPARPESLTERSSAQLAFALESERTLRGLVRSAHIQLAQRDDELARLSGIPVQRADAARAAELAALTAERDALAARVTGLEEECDRLRELIARDANQIDAIRATRVWRLGCAWWQLKAAISGR